MKFIRPLAAAAAGRRISHNTSHDGKPSLRKPA
jgi:hypothetical protein